MLLFTSNFAVNSSCNQTIRLRCEDVLASVFQVYFAHLKKYWEKPCAACPAFEFNLTPTRDHNFLNSSTALKILAASSGAVVFLP